MSTGEVYLVGVLEGCYKIGRSNDSEKRLLSYSPKLPVTLTIHHRISTDNSVWLESILHAAFAHRRCGGEWFRLTGDDVRLVCAIVALRQNDMLPGWLGDLIQAHHPEGFRPKALPRPSSVDDGEATLVQDSTDEGETATRSVLDGEGDDQKVEAGSHESATSEEAATTASTVFKPIRKRREKNTYEIDVDRGDGGMEPVAALKPQDYPRYLLSQIEHDVIAEIDGVLVLKRIIWVNGRPALEAISGVSAADLIFFDSRRCVRVVAFVAEWLKEWTDEEIEKAVTIDRERAEKREQSQI